MAEDRITILEACKILHRSEKQVRRYVTTGRLPAEISEDGKYYILKSDVERLGRHPDRLQEDKLARRITGLESRIDKIEKGLDSLSTRVDEIIEALYAMSAPPTAQPPPTTRAEPAKPSVAHSGAIAEGQPEGTITLQELAQIVDRNEGTLKGHIKKWDEHPEQYPQFAHIKVPIGTSGQNRRYFTTEQVETWTSWIAANTKKGAGD